MKSYKYISRSSVNIKPGEVETNQAWKYHTSTSLTHDPVDTMEEVGPNFFDCDVMVLINYVQYA